MLYFDSGKKIIVLALLALAFVCASRRVTRAATTTIYTDNLSKMTGGTESVTGTRRLAGSFQTGTDATYLQSIALLLASPTSGQATVSIYSNRLLNPGTLVGTLTSPASFTSSAAETTFTASGMPLAANTTYWVVLQVNSGTFNWSWTTDNIGSGTGYTHVWGESDDAGSTWQTYNVYPLQMRVTASSADTNVSTIQFTSSSFQAGEGEGSVAVTITRSGDTTSTATIGYATSDASGLNACNSVSGVASSRCDYTSAVGTFSFAAGETSKTLMIPLVDDGFAEGNESFTVTLSNVSGASLGANSTATVTVIDNESSNLSANPIDRTAFFVRQHYLDFLGRVPDAAGYQGWQDILSNCASGSAACDRIEVSAGFFRSPEFQSRGYFIYRFYSAAMGRTPLYSEFMPDFAKVSGYLTDAQLEANKAAFAAEFMSRTEFRNKYDSLTTPTAYVDALLQAAGLTSHPSRDSWINGLTSGTLSRADVLRSLVGSAESYTKFYNQAFVVMQYFGYLRRDPDILYLEWINTMNQNGGDYRAMINGFMNSTEYRQRFGQ